MFFNSLKFIDALEEFKFSYDNYVEWESKGGKDLLLGANRLTTHQLFWLALARSRYRKQKDQPGIEGNDYNRTFFFFKNKYEPLETYDSFKEAYQCSKPAPVVEGKKTDLVEEKKPEKVEVEEAAPVEVNKTDSVEEKKPEGGFFSFLSNLG